MAIVTGAGRGIGRASAIQLAREGARVVVATVTPENGEETVRLIEQVGGEGIFVKTDVTKRGAVENTVRTAVEEFGSLNILFNNAGIEGPQSELKDTSEEEFDHTFDVNLKSVFRMTNAAVPEMIRAGGGAIINNASTFAFVATEKFGVYCATKAAIVALTKNYALELARYNIRVNAVCPGGTVSSMHPRYLGGRGTEQEKRRLSELIFERTRPGELLTGDPSEVAHLARHPIGRFGSPYEIARVVVFLASDDSSFMTGAAVLVDGGYTLI